MEPETPVTHIFHPEYGVGIVANREWKYEQVPVEFPVDGQLRFCYPENLRVVRQAAR